jgi:hypothetical protein
MFWVDTLRDEHRYCICQGAFTAFQIVHAKVDKNNLMVFMTAEDGNRCLIYQLKKGWCVPAIKEFNFSHWEHVKIEVVGGEITMAGTSDDDAEHRFRASTHFKSDCPFGSEEDWVRDRELVHVDNAIQKLIDTAKKSETL